MTVNQDCASLKYKCAHFFSGIGITFRHRRPLAAYYYYLPCKPKDKSCRTKRVEPGLVIDFAREGRPIGIEILAPAMLTLRAFNHLLVQLGFHPLKRTDLAPIKAA